LDTIDESVETIKEDNNSPYGIYDTLFTFPRQFRLRREFNYSLQNQIVKKEVSHATRDSGPLNSRSFSETNDTGSTAALDKNFTCS
jgi:hypothetical protein